MVACIYTDGSVMPEESRIEPGIGAAVYIPAHPEKGRQARTIAVDCKYKNDPQKPACVNTINRAELAAIKVAVDVALSEAYSGSETEVRLKYSNVYTLPLTA